MIKKRRFADGGNISSTPMPTPPNPPQVIGGSGVSPSGVNIQPTPQPASPQPAYPPPPVPGGNMFKKGGKIKPKGKMTKMAKGGGLAAKKAMALAALSMAARRGAGSVPPPRPSMGAPMGAGSPPPGLGGPPPGMKKGGKMKKFAKGGKTAMSKAMVHKHEKHEKHEKHDKAMSKAMVHKHEKHDKAMKKFAKGGSIDGQPSERHRQHDDHQFRHGGIAERGKTAMKKFAKGGSIDGIAERGKTKAKGANIGPVVGKKKGGMC